MTEMESLCRICLGEEATIPIFVEFLNEDGSNHSIQEKLALCLDGKFENAAGYPQCICNDCLNTLNQMFDLINKYKETCKILEKKLQIFVKQECIDYEYHNDLANLEDKDNLFDAIDSEPIQKQIKIEFEDGTKCIDYEDHNNLANREDKNNLFDAFEPEPIQKQINVEFEDGENFIEKIKMLCKKPSKKKQVGKKTTRKRTSIRKTKNKIPKHKINSRESSLSSEGQEEDWCPLQPPETLKESSKPVLCESCGETFTSHKKLKLHENQKHKNIKPLCPTCKRTYASELSLKRHIMRKHSDVKEFICSECGKGFAFIYSLKIHTKGVHEKTLPKKVYKRLPCKLCDKDFISKALLIIHQRSAHTGERPAVCTVCNKSFFHEDYLKQHMRLHTGERPYECPVCGRGYAQRGNMKSHMRNHRISELDQKTLSKIKTSWHRFMKP